MAKVTLQLLYEEFKKLNEKTDRLEEKTDRLEARGDSQFELLKEQILLTRTELKSEMQDGFAKVHKELKVIRHQTAHLTERVATLEHQSKQ